jgi:serine/threonine-protein kinase
VPRADRLPEVSERFANRFELESILGEGGYGAVYAARDEQRDRDVAVKVLLTDDPIAIARFQQEARVAASLDTEHVAAVHEVGTTEDGVAYIVMERLHGRDLADVLAERHTLPVGEAVGLVLEAMLGLAHAHARGIVHRDLKPRNLFLVERADGTRIVKVLDFGIAKTAAPLTNSGDILGTTRYMAPEQLRDSRAVDTRCDIWALGVVLYELLTGQLIHDARTSPEFGMKVLTEPHVPVRERDASLPEQLDAVIARCLAKEPADRPADLAALAELLRPWDERGLADRIARIVRVAPPRRRAVVALALVAAAIAGLGIGFAVMTWLR